VIQVLSVRNQTLKYTTIGQARALQAPGAAIPPVGMCIGYRHSVAVECEHVERSTLQPATAERTLLNRSIMMAPVPACDTRVYFIERLARQF
jgi:hypothetical protein